MKTKITWIIAAAAALGIGAAGLVHGQQDWDPYKLPDKAQSYATDQATYNAAKREAEAARQDIIKARQAEMTAQLTSPEYLKATREVADANAKYQATRNRTKADLAGSNPDYIRLLADLNSVEKEIAAARAAGNTPYDAFAALYKKKEDITKQMRVIEDKSLDQVGATDMRQQWSAASKNVEAMKQQQKLAAENAPGVAQAKDKLAGAQKKQDDASIKLAGSRAAYDEASFQQGKVDEYNDHYAPGIDWYGDWTNSGYGGYRGGVTVYRR